MTGRKPGHGGGGLGPSPIKPSAKRALLPAWLERSFTCGRPAFSAGGLLPNMWGLVRDVGPFPALRGVAAVRWACPRLCGSGSGGCGETRPADQREAGRSGWPMVEPGRGDPWELGPGAGGLSRRRQGVTSSRWVGRGWPGALATGSRRNGAAAQQRGARAECSRSGRSKSAGRAGAASLR